MEMLNFKDEVGKIKGNFVEKDMVKESEFSAIQDKIRKLKMDIGGKLQKLRNNRKNSKSKKKNKGMESKSNFAPSMKLALTELKDAVEVVSMELMKQREEIKCLIKQLYDEDI
jgi:hypothetical protein